VCDLFYLSLFFAHTARTAILGAPLTVFAIFTGFAVFFAFASIRRIGSKGHQTGKQKQFFMFGVGLLP
jgi:hypothetical protein